MSRIETIKNFHASKLGNDRDIDIYLPEGYEENKKERYPVLYLQDGQSVFDNGKSGTGRSWKLDAVADRLIREKRIEKIIMVAIPHVNRTIEYCYYTWKDKKVRWDNGAGFDYSINGRGEAYADFVIHELKPFIDAHYRTLPDSDNTALMGSSDGGFITFNMGIRHPDVFGKIAVMSPAFFAMDMDYFRETEVRNRLIWMDTGEKELCLNHDARNMAKQLMEKGYVDGENLFFYFAPDGEHTEADWGARVFCPLILFFGNVGKPVKVRLATDERISLNEKEAFLNPIIIYESHVRRSDLNGEYAVSDHGVLDVEKSGEITPKAPGKTEIIYRLHDLVLKREITVDAELTDTVEVEFVVQVPEDTPKDARVGIDTGSPLHVELQKKSAGVYSGKAVLKRGTKFMYRIKMYRNFRLITELNAKDEIPCRRLHATEREEIRCRVEKWEH